MQHNNTPNITSLRIIHFALCLGVFMFGSVANFILIDHTTASFEFTERNQPFVFVAFILCVFGAGTATVIYKLLLSKNKDGDIQSKFNTYSKASIIRYAAMEGAVLFCIVMSFIENNYLFSIMGGATYLVMILSFPSKSRFAMDMGLGRNESDDIGA